MNNDKPSRQVIIDAYEALDGLLDCTTKNPIVYALQQNVLKALPPKPLTTMADVEWDEEKHGLAAATHTVKGKVIMMKPSLNGKRIEIVYKHDNQAFYEVVSAATLTPIES